MALIVEKRRMTLTNEILLTQAPNKCWCGPDANSDPRQLITIPTTSIEKLKAAFPACEDKVFSHKYIIGAG